MSTEEAGPQRRKILIIDDEPMIRNFLAMLLDEQYSVILAASGIEGIRLAKSQLPDLILLDVLMPDHDGIACLQELRAIPETARTPVLMLTALNDAKRRDEALSAGASDYILKPFRADELVNRIRAKLEERPRDATVTALRLCQGDLTLNLATQSARCHDLEMSLNASEFKLLATLVRRKGQPTPVQDLATLESLSEKLEDSQLVVSGEPGSGFVLITRPDLLPLD